MKTFKADCLDRPFRAAVKSVLAKVQKQIVVITGEFSVLNYYHDLRIDLDTLFKERTVKFKVYMAEENYGVINKMFFLNPGRTEVYVGKKKVEDHYLICDDSYFVHTRKHKRDACGVRAGEYEDENPQRGRRYIRQKGLNRLFDELISQEGVKKISGPDMSKDPLYAELT